MKRNKKELLSKERESIMIVFWAKWLLLLFYICFIIENNEGSLFAGQERDPLVSLDDKTKEEQTFNLSKVSYPVKLNGIIWRQGCPVAIINDEIVQEGEQWKDFTVTKIEPDKIVLQYGKFNSEVFLTQEEKK